MVKKQCQSCLGQAFQRSIITSRSYINLWISNAPFKWLVLNDKSRLPHYSTHYLGAGGLIINDKSQILLVREKNGVRAGNWGIPGGLVDDGELITEAAVREIKEETGLETEPIDLIWVREALGYKFGKTDIYFVVTLRLKQQEQKVNLCEKELSEYRWVSLDKLDEFMKEEKFGPTQIYFIEFLHQLYLKKQINRQFFTIESGIKPFYGQDKKFSLFKVN